MPFLESLLAYSMSTARLYLIVFVPIVLVRAAVWYFRYIREARAMGDGFVVKSDDAGAIRERPVDPRTLEYWHEPLWWIHIPALLLTFLFAPMLPLVLMRGFATKPWLTGSEYALLLFVAGLVAGVLLVWVHSVRGFQFAVTEEGIAFKRGLLGKRLLRWERVSEAEVVGARPLFAVVTGTDTGGKPCTVVLMNGFYRKADFETITNKLVGTPRPAPGNGG